MDLSLVEIKEKLKPQLKTILSIDDFRIVRAEHSNKIWTLFIEYQEVEKGPAGVAQFFKTKTSGLLVEAETGKIEGLIQ